MPRVAQDVGALLLRAVLGVVFIAHGLSKAGNPAGTEQFFDSIGIPLAGMMAPLATLHRDRRRRPARRRPAHPLAGVALAVTMGVALVAQHLGNGFFASDGGYEYVLVLGVACLAIAAIGPGRLSLDAALKLPHRVAARLRPAVAGR